MMSAFDTAIQVAATSMHDHLRWDLHMQLYGHPIPQQQHLIHLPEAETL